MLRDCSWSCIITEVWWSVVSGISSSFHTYLPKKKGSYMVNNKQLGVISTTLVGLRMEWKLKDNGLSQDCFSFNDLRLITFVTSGISFFFSFFFNVFFNHFWLFVIVNDYLSLGLDWVWRNSRLRGACKKPIFWKSSWRSCTEDTGSCKREGVSECPCWTSWSSWGEFQLACHNPCGL